MSKDEYLITDAPLKALTVFAMPMILGSFFQQVYNMADSIIVGQFVGSSALAAVGACAALTNVFICVALGAGVGAGVLVSRYFGAREYGKMKTIVFHASDCCSIGSPAVYRYDDCTGSGKSLRHAGTGRICGNNAGGACCAGRLACKLPSFLCGTQKSGRLRRWSYLDKFGC